MHRPPSSLARPLLLPGGALLPNRIVKAALSEALATSDGAPTEELVHLYRRWSGSGAGLLLTGNVMVAADGREGPRAVLVEDDRHLPLLRRWADAAQSGGARLWMQINHAGRQTPARVTRRPVAPSPIKLRGMAGLVGRPVALTDRQIRALVRRFATTAAVAREAGFAGIQIHAAHGYLISQFLSPLSNHRDDDWGGDEVRRARFLIEIVRATRAAVGARFPIAVKLNSADFQRGGFGEAESMNVVRMLEAEGIDLLEISGGNYESPAMVGSGELTLGRGSSRAREAYFLDYARAVRGVTRVPLLLTGGLRSAAAMNQVVASGEVDLIGLGRPMTTEPDLPARILSGAAESAAAIPVRSRIRLIHDFLQNAWYQSQLHRMGRGLDPDPGLSRLRAILATFARNYAYNPLRRPPLALAPAGASVE
jgi:2,4-dienoyl-CoA reductase-like NADH-dependent reductase (Old Yellow Enzyme family)